MYRTFLQEVGIRFIESEVPHSRALEGIRLAPTDEPCPGVKIAFYHCKTLLDRGCDAVFMPAVVSLSPTGYCCPKMMGLPDMVRAGLRLDAGKVISPVINVKDDPLWERSWSEAARELGLRNPERAFRALRAAGSALKEAQEVMVRDSVPAYRLITPCPPESSEGELRNEDSPVTALMGHAYVLYDAFGADILRMVRSFGRVVTAEMVSEDTALREVRTVFEGEKLWSFEAHILGSSFHLLKNKFVDRIIFVSSFSCGPASIIENYIEDEAERQGIPFLGLVVDEHTEPLGLLTRIETFMDATSERGRRKTDPPVVPVTSKGETKSPASPPCTATGSGGVPRKVEGSPPGTRPSSPADFRGPEPPSRPGIVTMGNLHVVLKALFDECGLDVLTPPELSDGLVTLGRELAPEFICYPMVALLGQCRELCRAGAQRIAMVMGKGKCRLGWYAQVMENLLRRAGHQVEVVGFDSPFPWKDRGPTFLAQARKIVGRPAARQVLRGASLALCKLVLLERAEEMLRDLRAREQSRGSGDTLYRSFLRETEAASSISSCRRAFARFVEACAEVPVVRLPVITVLLVGEIYVLNEPFVNKDIERILGSLDERVRVKRNLTVMSWLKRHVLSLPASVLRESRVRKAASGYLRLQVGGHGLESVGESVLAARSGVDGVVHLLPFTCMPEIVAQSILPSVDEDLGLPILSLVLSEQTGAVGLRTRLEAFVELASRRKRSFEKGGGG